MEQPAVESVDQTDKVTASKSPLPIGGIVVDENSQAKHISDRRVDKSTPGANVGQENQSSTDDDYDTDGLLSLNSRWEPSEELDALLKSI